MILFGFFFKLEILKLNYDDKVMAIQLNSDEIDQNAERTLFLIQKQTKNTRNFMKNSTPPSHKSMKKETNKIKRC